VTPDLLTSRPEHQQNVFLSQGGPHRTAMLHLLLLLLLLRLLHHLLLRLLLLLKYLL